MIESNNYKEDHMICATCGTQYADMEDGHCVNGHDDWLEPNDSVELFSRASDTLGLTMDEIVDKIATK